MIVGSWMEKVVMGRESISSGGGRHGDYRFYPWS